MVYICTHVLDKILFIQYCRGLLKIINKSVMLDYQSASYNNTACDIILVYIFLSYDLDFVLVNYFGNFQGINRAYTYIH